MEGGDSQHAGGKIWVGPVSPLTKGANSLPISRLLGIPTCGWHCLGGWEEGRPGELLLSDFAERLLNTCGDDGTDHTARVVTVGAEDCASPC